jgi:hypothetical protein
MMNQDHLPCCQVKLSDGSNVVDVEYQPRRPGAHVIKVGLRKRERARGREGEKSETYCCQSLLFFYLWMQIFWLKEEVKSSKVHSTD